MHAVHFLWSRKYVRASAHQNLFIRLAVSREWIGRNLKTSFKINSFPRAQLLGSSSKGIIPAWFFQRENRKGVWCFPVPVWTVRTEIIIVEGSHFAQQEIYANGSNLASAAWLAASNEKSQRPSKTTVPSSNWTNSSWMYGERMRAQSAGFMCNIHRSFLKPFYFCILSTILGQGILVLGHCLISRSILMHDGKGFWK